MPAFAKEYVGPLLLLSQEGEEAIRLKAVEGIEEVNNLRKDLIDKNVLTCMHQFFGDRSIKVRMSAINFWNEYFSLSEESPSEDHVRLMGPIANACVLCLGFEDEDRKNVMQESMEYIG